LARQDNDRPLREFRQQSLDEAPADTARSTGHNKTLASCSLRTQLRPEANVTGPRHYVAVRF
jgi:hypothetical protein